MTKQTHFMNIKHESTMAIVTLKGRKCKDCHCEEWGNLSDLDSGKCTFLTRNGIKYDLCIDAWLQRMKFDPSNEETLPFYVLATVCETYFNDPTEKLTKEITNMKYVKHPQKWGDSGASKKYDTLGLICMCFGVGKEVRSWSKLKKTVENRRFWPFLFLTWFKWQNECYHWILRIKISHKKILVAPFEKSSFYCKKSQYSLRFDRDFIWLIGVHGWQ